jgi:hypothetical protein
MASTRLIFTRDRTFTLQFTLHRSVSVDDKLYWAMKNDHAFEYYDIDPMECTLYNQAQGVYRLTITNDLTINLDIGKYYGELMRVTASGAYQTLQKFDIDLVDEIISSRDI